MFIEKTTTLRVLKEIPLFLVLSLRCFMNLAPGHLPANGMYICLMPEWRDRNPSNWMSSASC